MARFDYLIDGRMNAMPSAVHSITVLETGACFPCGEDEFVLKAMIHARSGPVHHGCCGGGCGVCRIRIVSGSYEIAKNMSRAHVSETDIVDGIALLCCVQPRSDLVVTRTY
ncbi:MAG: 2Fe-2S iron-sulfur cluster binding domain-containing protein [Clostridiales bacterium]|nr:2Fe-2S iron-sulfur cluster binding domain-containing protein [Clostridiales bacterium]